MIWCDGTVLSTVVTSVMISCIGAVHVSGSAILVRPVTDMAAAGVNVYLPGGASQVCLPHLSTYTCLMVPARYVKLVCQRLPAWQCQPGMFTSSVNVYLPDSSSQVCLARLSY